jgi:hypothetical protein
VHPVRREVLGLHRLERARADVQRDESRRDSRGAQRPEQRLVEVQPGGRRGDGPAWRA